MEQQQWPADKVERRPLSSLVAYARNARKHSAAQVSQIVESIRKWGWTMPVLVDEDGGIIAGHGRVMAADQLGLTDVPVMVAVGWTEDAKRAYVIADNKLAMNADWDFELLTAELAELESMMPDMTVIGFSDVELASLLHAPADVMDVMGEWGGMPEFVSDDLEAYRSIIMHFRSPEDVEAFGKLIDQQFTDKTRFLWYPANVIDHWSKKRYVDDGEPEPVSDLHPEQEPGEEHGHAPVARPNGRSVPADRRGSAVQ